VKKNERTRCVFFFLGGGGGGDIDEGAMGDVAGALDWTFAGEGGSNGATEGGIGSFVELFVLSRIGG
jgi:hypothetical protein